MQLDCTTSDKTTTLPAWLATSPPAPCPSWCTLPADHLDLEELHGRVIGWSREHEAFAAIVPTPRSRARSGSEEIVCVDVTQFESAYENEALATSPVYLRVMGMHSDFPLFGDEAIALANAVAEAGGVLARITSGARASIAPDRLEAAGVTAS
jgi:hypothetical protein